MPDKKPDTIRRPFVLLDNCEWANDEEPVTAIVGAEHYRKPTKHKEEKEEKKTDD